MSALTFDTLKFVKELESAGMPAAQAEAQARALAAVLETNLDQIATKADLSSLEDRLTARLYQAIVLQTFALAALFGGLKLLA